MAGLLALRAICTVLLASMLAWTTSVDSSSLTAVWQQELPNTGIPQEFEELASPLSTSVTQGILSKVKAFGLVQASESKEFCTSAGIYCPQKDVVIPLAGPQPRVCIPPFFNYEYGVLPCLASAASVSAVQASGVFIRQQALVVGKKVQIPDTSNDLGGLKFLPSLIEAALPKFVGGSLDELKRCFGVKKGSDMELEMENTLAHCALKSEHEVRACVASGEDMVSFVSQTVGQNADVYTAPLMSKQEVTIMDTAILGSLGEKTVSCHNMKFPSLVYSCHMTQTSQVMAVSVKLASGHIAHMPVICHMDTSYWNPSHIAFKALNVQPGKSSVCHWFPENSFIFVEKTDA